VWHTLGLDMFVHEAEKAKQMRSLGELDHVWDSGTNPCEQSVHDLPSRFCFSGHRVCAEVQLSLVRGYSAHAPGVIHAIKRTGKRAHLHQCGSFYCFVQENYRPTSAHPPAGMLMSWSTDFSQQCYSWSLCPKQPGTGVTSFALIQRFLQALQHNTQ